MGNGLRHRGWFPFWAGVAGGGIAVVLLAGAYLMGVAGRPVSSQPTGSPAANPTPTPGASIPTPLTTPTPGTPASPFSALLLEAEEVLRTNHPAEAIAAVQGILGDLSREDEIAQAYHLLARAELMEGRFQRAAAYYDALFAYRSTPSVLYGSAYSYDLGGDLHRALERYLRLAAWEGQAAELYRSIAEERIRGIVEFIGTPTPVSSGH